MIQITSGKLAGTPRNGYVIDASRLPNPYDVPKLMPRDGTNRLVKEWLLPQIQDKLDQWEKEIALGEFTAVTTLCNAGRHRSVAVAEELASRLKAQGHSVTVKHREIKPKKKESAAKRGYGAAHKVKRQQLLYSLRDGTECDYCGRPMYKDSARNFDGAALEADHLQQDKGHLAARLLHRQCNRKMSQPGSWVEHGPEWYAAHEQLPIDGSLDWPTGRVVAWIDRGGQKI
ncbi:hypothetical protein I6I10_06955 [Corynebacterium glucuronolyticum]|uniref:RapZ C-terminal domain-containing protein n=1 Tax=Corynebacterium glucuronolyticum TaxID=39791 RepID=A0A7T4JW76_9CORY|nr:RNase adapter RapZ [Corynebacterium glucuronolyticum]QQB45348.1 hypothetical protein I6I10_07325 [Corynebacterium glucuronolyticum]QQB47597.1 hypothetical protein I6I10_06955 [Corynebacterium glucuronolyticum]WKD64036.1 glmZ(sRNA)-inactivating NTPase [Corynebacterium glucuronolyticum DSM 44120]SMB81479.1 Predicted P-loop-containing kinase [Corynebacterium glucuronolyticum]